jgi:hypothetical protein
MLTTNPVQEPKIIDLTSPMITDKVTLDKEVIDIFVARMTTIDFNDLRRSIILELESASNTGELLTYCQNFVIMQGFLQRYNEHSEVPDVDVAAHEFATEYDHQ